MTDLHSQAALYVAGALPPAETAEFETHLSECDRCTAEVAASRATAAELSLTVAAVPPPSLRAAVLAAIAEVPQLPAPQETVQASGSAPPAETASPNSRHATVTPLHRSSSARLPALLAAAAVIAALGFGGWAWQGREAAHREAQQAGQQVSRLTELLSARDVKTVTGRGVASGMSGTVVLSPSRREAVLVAKHLPQLPAGKVYEAWTIKTATPARAGTFTAAQAKSLVPLPPSALAAQSVAVTVEPAGGSPQPTTDAILTVNIPHPA